MSGKAARGLVRSMLVIGGAQAVNILLSILRMKALAVLLGPAGVGLLSIYNNIQSTAANAAGLGLRNSGVRELAANRNDIETLSRVRWVLFAAHLVQGFLAMVAVWLSREPLALWLLDDPRRGREVGLVGVAILLALLSSSQTALLQGLRRIGDLGRVTVLGALAGTLAGIAAVWLQGEEGLIWFLLVQPLAVVLVAFWYTRRLPKPARVAIGLGEIWRVWKPMAKLGVVFMLGGLVTTLTLLAVRSEIVRSLGLDAAGQFAAAWGITMTYVGFLLSAMGADYYPRLTEVIHDKPAAIRLMNEQMQLSLAIGGPVLLLLIGVAPWVITLLYSADFRPAVTLLQWQSLGNVIKLASWALSFSIVAAAKSKSYFFMESSFNVVYLALVWSLLPSLGLLITAIAFVVGYGCYFLIVQTLARRYHAFRYEKLSLGLLALHLSLAAGLLALSLTAPLAGAGVAALLALATGLFGLRLVLGKIGPGGRLITPLTRAYAAIGWPVKEQTL